LGESKAHSWNDLRTESATELTDQSETHTLSEPWSESEGQSAIHSRVESASHLWNESAGDSWNELPNAHASGGLTSVRNSVWRLGASTVRDGDNREAGCGDVGGDVLALVLSDAKSDEQSASRSLQASDRVGLERSADGNLRNLRDLRMSSPVPGGGMRTFAAADGVKRFWTLPSSGLECQP